MLAFRLEELNGESEVVSLYEVHISCEKVHV